MMGHTSYYTSQKLHCHQQCYFQFQYMMLSLCPALVNVECFSIGNMPSVEGFHISNHARVHRSKASSHVSQQQKNLY